MKEGKSIKELAAEIQRQSEKKRDFIAPTEALEMHHTWTGKEGNSYDLEMKNGSSQAWTITPIAHSQIADRLGIPLKYYNRMISQAPDLLISNVNHWLWDKPEKRMIRTLDDQARAFLSDRYRRLDNDELMEAIMPTLLEYPDLQIASCEITDKRLYLKATTPRIQVEVAPGDPVQAGVVISNSEVGMGTLKVEPLILRLVCQNGMIAGDQGMKRYHIGRPQEEGEIYLSDEAREAEDKAIWLRARDIVKGVMSEEVFRGIVQDLQLAKDRRIERSPIDAVEELAQKKRLNQGEKEGILQQLIDHEERTQYGLINAVTRASQDIEDYDRATELEALGGQILTMASKEWKQIAAA